MNTSKQQLSEARAVQLVRNALLVAGHEMGETGDHWPAIKYAIKKIMQDYEELQIERNVHAELRQHLYADLDKMERILLTCPKEERVEVEPKLKELRDIYDAYFSEIDEELIFIDPEEIPAHVKSAEAIIKTLEGEDA